VRSPIQINFKVNIKNSIPHRVTSNRVVWWKGRYVGGLKYAVRTLGDASVHISLKNCSSIVVAGWLQYFFLFHFVVFNFFIFSLFRKRFVVVGHGMTCTYKSICRGGSRRNTPLEISRIFSCEN
jgi:hypothetical protein